MNLKHFTFFCFLLVIARPFSAQILLNGDFSSGTSNWGCGVEVNSESTYGGSSSNPVVEVDAGAGLCQTMSSLTIGNSYLVSFSSSRRTGGCPSPSSTNINVSVSGGVLSTTITRTNTTFGFSSDYFLFIANSTTHTVTFSAGSGFGGSTCGMIMDNFVVTFSPLPVELLNFNANYTANGMEFSWSTASEKNNAYFIIQKSSDGINFSDISTTASKATRGNSSSRLNFVYKQNSLLDEGLNYYRLKQVDLDHTFSYSDIITLDTPLQEGKLFPNPNAGEFSISIPSKGKVEISILNQLQQIVYSDSQFLTSESKVLTVDSRAPLRPGHYLCLIKVADASYHFPLIVQ